MAIEQRQWMASQHPAFEQLLDANPDDRTTRMVYADWLDETGWAVEAALKRLEANPNNDDLRRAYADRLEEEWRRMRKLTRHGEAAGRQRLIADGRYEEVELVANARKQERGNFVDGIRQWMRWWVRTHPETDWGGEAAATDLANAAYRRACRVATWVGLYLYSCRVRRVDRKLGLVRAIARALRAAMPGRDELRQVVEGQVAECIADPGQPYADDCWEWAVWSRSSRPMGWGGDPA
jgi:uncharacterized protein (TIGR02996 family)